MSYSVVASGIKASPSGGDVTTDAADTTGAGMIALVLEYYHGGVLSTPPVDDTYHNTWTALTDRRSSNQGCILYYCLNPTVGPGHQFMTTGGAFFPVLSFYAASTTGTAAFSSQNGAVTSSASSLQPGSVTPPEDGCLVVAGLNYGGSTGGASINSGFTAQYRDGVAGVNISGAGARLIQGTAAAVNPTWSWTGAGEAAAAIAVFSGSGGGGGPSPVTVPVTDANWFFSPYNWFKSGSTYAQTPNPGAYCKPPKFSGSTTCKLNVDVTPLTAVGVAAGNYPAILYSIDSAAYTRYQLTSADSQVTLGTGLTTGTHTVEVHLDGADYTTDRYTTPTMVLRITGMELDSGATTSAPTLRPNRVLVYADSNGEGLEALGAGTSVANQAAARAFPAILGWALDAEYGVIAYASQGYVTAGGGNVPALTTAWDKYHSGASRLSGGLFSPAPDWLFSFHGENDGSDVTSTVTGLVSAWRAAAGPSARLVFAAGWGANRYAEIAAGVAAAGDAKAHAINPGAPALFSGLHGTTYHLFAAYGHPRYAARTVELARAAADAGGGSGGGFCRYGMNGGF